MVRDFVHYILKKGRKAQKPSAILPPLRPSPRWTLPINEERYCMPAPMLPLVYLTLDYYMLYICRYALQMEIMYVDSTQIVSLLWFSKMACAYYHASFKEINPFQFLRSGRSLRSVDKNISNILQIQLVRNVNEQIFNVEYKSGPP